MKKNFVTARLVLLAAVTTLLVQGCLKDTGTQHYVMYTPFYKTTAQVRAGIKNDVAQPIVTAGKMYVQGNYIFLVEKEKGIHIIDNSNPSSPVNKAFITIPGNEDIAVSGNILYADCYTDLLAIDVSNVNNIVLKSFTANVFADRQYVNGYCVDSGKVIFEWQLRDTVIDIQLREGQGIWRNGNYITSTPIYALSLSASANTTTGVGGSMARMAIQNNHLYAVSTESLLSISIANPTAPDFLSSKNLHLGIGSAETIYPFQDKLFIGSMSGMYIFSTTDPNNPSLLSTFTHATVCDPVITDGTNAFITLHSGTYCTGVDNELDVVNVQDVVHPSFVKKYTLTHPLGLGKDGNTLIVCDGDLKIYDATNVNAIQLKQSIAMSDPYDVICINGLAIVSAKDGLYQFDYTNPSNVKQLSKLSITQ